MDGKPTTAFAQRPIDRRVLARRAAAFGLAASAGGLAAWERIVAAQEITPSVEANRADEITGGTAPLPERFDDTFKHHIAEANGVRLHYVIGGRGDPVVLLHGWPQTWYEWRRIMPALAERYTVIAPDLRGAGDSAKPVTGYDKRTMAEDVYHLVRQLGFERVYLVGHDIGLQVAYSYAASHPESVRRLVVLDSVLPGIGPWDQIRLAPFAWHFAFHGVRDLPEAVVTGREWHYLSHFYRSLAYDPSWAAEDEVAEYVRAYSAPGALRAGFEWYRAFPQDAEDNRALALTKLPMPVLALGGAASAGDMVLTMMREVATDVRGGTVPLAGHFVPEEAPADLVGRLLSFFGEEG